MRSEVPQNLHLIWLGEIDFTPYTGLLDRFIHNNPSYKVTIWVDDLGKWCKGLSQANIEMSLASDIVGSKHKPMFDHLMEYGAYHGAADIVRLAALNSCGGIYSDLNAIPYSALPQMEVDSHYGFKSPIEALKGLDLLIVNLQDGMEKGDKFSFIIQNFLDRFAQLGFSGEQLVDKVNAVIEDSRIEALNVYFHKMLETEYPPISNLLLLQLTLELAKRYCPCNQKLGNIAKRHSNNIQVRFFLSLGVGYFIPCVLP